MPLVLRDDFDAAQLRLCARQSDDAGQVRRLLALAAIYDGASRAEAAEIGGVTRQIVRDWVERLNTSGPDALVARKAPGKSPLLTPGQRAALAQVVEDGPTPAIDGVVRWRLVDWRNGYGTGLPSVSRARRWAANCAPCGIASCRPARDTTRRQRAQ